MTKIFSRWRACSRLFPRSLVLFLVTGSLAEFLFLQLGPLMQRIVDSLTSTPNRDQIVYWIILGMIIGILDAITNRICWTSKEYIQSLLRGKLLQSHYSNLLTKDYAYLTTLGTGTIQSKMEKGIDAEVAMYGDILNAILSVGVRASILIVIFFQTLPLINACFLVLGSVVLMIHHLLLPRIKKMQHRLSKINEQATTQTTKIAMEWNTMRLHNQQYSEMQKLDHTRKPHPGLARKTDLFNEIGFTVMDIGFRLLSAGGYFIMGASVLSAEMSIGTMLMILMYMDWMRRPISTLMQQMSSRRKNIVRSERMHALLNHKNILSDGSERLILPLGDIVIDNIEFGYPHYDQSSNNDDEENYDSKTPTTTSPEMTPPAVRKPLFSHFSLTLAAGTMTALVGRSGSGKTTVIKLLLRLYDVSAGRIRIGNQDLCDLSRENWYEHVGYLSQDPGIFDGTVRENLMYGVSLPLDLTPNPSALDGIYPTRRGEDDDRLWQALELACIADRVRQFGRGLDEALGEKGVKLSGGEKQRLAIARLFLRDPQLIILDEPSAALDSESEHLITQSFGKLFANKTVIVIAHRLQTVMHADQIVVMEQGQIIEQGKHNDLIARGGVYAGLVDLQQGRVSG